LGYAYRACGRYTGDKHFDRGQTLRGANFTCGGYACGYGECVARDGDSSRGTCGAYAGHCCSRYGFGITHGACGGYAGDKGEAVRRDVYGPNGACGGYAGDRRDGRAFYDDYGTNGACGRYAGNKHRYVRRGYNPIVT
tara:strand:+ start:680 stop:1093 length:414 start_codon:yes stop_codon:yes gene_type:complete